MVHADVSDYDAVLATLNEHEPDTIFHLAAQAIVGIANRSPLSTFESNIRGTYALLEACRARGVLGEAPARIVVASTDHAYGGHKNLPYREDYPLVPRVPLRRVQGLCGHDRPLLRHPLRDAGRRHPAGEPVRRR